MCFSREPAQDTEKADAVPHFILLREALKDRVYEFMKMT